MDEAAQIILRQANVKDKNFILSTWLKGQYFGNSFFRNIPQYLYFEAYAKVITKILCTPGVDINIACDIESPDWIVGYSVFKGEEIYWMHVRKDYRRQKLATLLITEQKPKVIKAYTKVGQIIAQRKGLIFNPF